MVWTMKYDASRDCFFVSTAYNLGKSWNTMWMRSDVIKHGMSHAGLH